MLNLKLTYFDIHGGRGEPARLALHIGGVAFEDDRIGFEEFGAKRAGYPFKRVPLLQIDDVELSQCNSINRYVGQMVACTLARSTACPRNSVLKMLPIG